MRITTRREAKNAGLMFYFTGKTCKRGHVIKRYVGNGNCVQCTAQQGNEHREENREEIKLHAKKYYEENRKRINLCHKKYYEENHEKINLLSKRWTKENPEKSAAKSMRRRARKKQQHDELVSKCVFDKIFKRSKEVSLATGIPHNVDHFQPTSKGGINTPSNLRIIPEIINKRKASKIWSEIELTDACHTFYKAHGLTNKTINSLLKGYNGMNILH